MSKCRGGLSYFDRPALLGTPLLFSVLPRSNSSSTNEIPLAYHVRLLNLGYFMFARVILLLVKLPVHL